jgi:pimeloyl-[acyl-carrier protein] methyl ester esterase
MPTLSVDGRQLYFEHYQGRGLPVLLIHGWGMSCRIWDTTLPALQAAGHAVVTFDQRGCGKSDKDFSEVTIDRSAADAVALLDHLGIRRVAVNGWSLGGAIAVAAAARLGDRCAGVVSTAGATPRYVQGPDYPFGPPAGTAAQTVGALRADRATFFAALAKGCVVTPQPAVENWLAAIFLETSPAADEALMELDTVDQRSLLAGLGCPVLAIVGAKDAIVAPEVGRQIAKHARRTTTVEFAESGHSPFLDEGPKYRQVLVDFLAGLS